MTQARTEEEAHRNRMDGESVLHSLLASTPKSIASLHAHSAAEERSATPSIGSTTAYVWDDRRIS